MEERRGCRSPGAERTSRRRRARPGSSWSWRQGRPYAAIRRRSFRRLFLRRIREEVLQVALRAGEEVAGDLVVLGVLVPDPLDAIAIEAEDGRAGIGEEHGRVGRDEE